MTLRYGQTFSDFVGADLQLIDITDQLKKVLDKFGLLIDSYCAYQDSVTGDIFVNLTDYEGDAIDVIFTVDEDDVPGCLILGENDMGIGWIDLHGVAKVVNGKIDFDEGRWFRYSILSNLLKLGNIDFKKVKESRSKSVVRTLTKIEEAFSVKGNSRVAVVSHRPRRKRLTHRQILGLASMRRRIQRIR